VEFGRFQQKNLDLLAILYLQRKQKTLNAPLIPIIISKTKMCLCNMMASLDQMAFLSYTHTTAARLQKS
jgi:hypothetical protein